MRGNPRSEGYTDQGRWYAQAVEYLDSQDEFGTASTAPVISVTPISTSDTTPIVSGSCDDDTATLTLTLDATTYSPIPSAGNWSQQVNALTVGSYTATLDAVDAAGNASTASGTITIESADTTGTYSLNFTNETVGALPADLSVVRGATGFTWDIADASGINVLRGNGDTSASRRIIVADSAQRPTGSLIEEIRTQFKVSAKGLDLTHTGAVLRFATTPSLYVAYIFELRVDTDRIDLSRVSAGTYGQLESPNFTWSANTLYDVLFQAENVNGTVILRGKIWPSSQAEPTTWNIEYTDNDGSQIEAVGRAGLTTSRTAGSNRDFYYLSYGHSGGAAPDLSTTAPPPSGGGLTFTYDADTHNVDPAKTVVTNGTTTTPTIAFTPRAILSEFKGVNKWRNFLLRIDGLNGKQPTFDVDFTDYWSSIDTLTWRPWYSYNNRDWFYWDTAVSGSGTLSFQLSTAFTGDTVYLAFNPAYTIERSLDLISWFETNYPTLIHPLPSTDANYVGDTMNQQTDEQGRVLPAQPIRGYGIWDDTRYNDNTTNKRTIVLTASLHAGEHSCSFVMEHWLKFLTSGTVQANSLLEKFHFLIYPIGNPMGTYGGSPRDDWDLNFPYTEPNDDWPTDGTNPGLECNLKHHQMFNLDFPGRDIHGFFDFHSSTLEPDTGLVFLYGSRGELTQVEKFETALRAFDGYHFYKDAGTSAVKPQYFKTLYGTDHTYTVELSEQRAHPGGIQEFIDTGHHFAKALDNVSTDYPQQFGLDGTSSTDTTAPVISVTPISTSDTTPIISGSCDDDTATLTLTLDATTYNPVPSAGSWSQQANALAAGSYTATLDAVDASGNASTDTATITIDTTAPVITLDGGSTITLSIGDTFTDPGATAQDDVDGFIPFSAFTVTGIVDTSTAGTYLRDYNVSDAAGNAAITKTRTVEVQANASVTAVTVPPDDVYIGGDLLQFVVSWSKTVNVSGSPNLELDIGGLIRQANYQAGSGTTDLIFQYVVQSSDSDQNGIAIVGLDLLASTITDNEGRDANSVLNNVGITAGVIITQPSEPTEPTSPSTTDTTLKVTSVSVPASRTYYPGETITFSVSWDGIVTVVGAPELELNIGGSVVYSDYVSGSETQTLIFSYTIEPGSLDSDGITVGPLSLIDDTLTDFSGANVDPTLRNIGSSTGVRVSPLISYGSYLSDGNKKITTFLGVFSAPTQATIKSNGTAVSTIGSSQITWDGKNTASFASPSLTGEQYDVEWQLALSDGGIILTESDVVYFTPNANDDAISPTINLPVTDLSDDASQRVGQQSTELYQGSWHKIVFPIAISGTDITSVSDARLELFRAGQIKLGFALGAGITLENSALVVRVEYFQTLPLRNSYDYELWIENSQGNPIFVRSAKIILNPTLLRF
jgi:hypothetical protein